MSQPLFNLPKITFNTDIWGPAGTPEQFDDLPYAPFSKNDRLGRIADFVTPSGVSRNRYGSNWNNRRGGEDNFNAELQYRFDTQDESTFQLVSGGEKERKDTGYRPKRQYFRRKDFAKINARGKGPVYDTSAKKKSEPRRDKRRTNNKKRWNNYRRDANIVTRENSISIQADWEVLEQFDMNQFGKLQTKIPSAEDLTWAGNLQTYNPEFDRITAKNPKPLRQVENRVFFNVTTTEDPILQHFATTGEGNVFATDAILSHLMASPKSVFPWDIVVHRVGSCVFFDKRASELDLLTVDETAYEPPSIDDKDLNNHDNLSIEATAINQSFSQQILDAGSDKESLENSNPFFETKADDGMEAAPIGYRYRKFDLGTEIKLVCRCEVHGMVNKKGEKLFMTSYALNEWQSKTGNDLWRRKIDNQRGAVLANELKNNACKLTKWTIQSLLAGADLMKLGFVSRKNISDPSSHFILGTQFYKPKDFAAQIALNQYNMWGVFKMMVELVMSRPEGKYLIMKDPNKSVMRLYNLPNSAIEEFDDEDKSMNDD